MPIKFECPHCKKSISAKEHLAGKKVKCPACKQALTVPAPVAAPADVEELAMSVLAEKPAEQPAAEAKPIEFTCPQCDEPVTVPADLAGKQTPCPHCRRIIKVPMPTKTAPKDWRKAPATGPSGARQTLEQPAPEGAWGTATAGRVSQDALVEAGALPEEKERLTLQQWLTRGAVAVVGLLVVGIAVAAVYRNVAGSRETRAVNQVLTRAKELNARQPEAAGELYRGVGEFYLRTNKRGCAGQARAQFRDSRDRLAAATGSERDPLLIELALTQLGLGGSAADVENETRMNWTPQQRKHSTPTPGVSEELPETLNLLHAPEARLTAVREMTRKLGAAGQAQLAAQLAATVATSSDDLRVEASALAGVELWRTDPAAAEAVAAEAVAALPAPDKGAKDKGAKPADRAAKVPASPSLIALCLALEKKELIEKFPPEWRAGAKSDDPAVLLGLIEGAALRGNPAEARPLFDKLTSADDRARGHLDVADALAAKQPDEARKEVEEAAREVAQHGRLVQPWTVLRMIRLGGRLGVGEQALQPLPGAVADPGLRGWAQLEVLRARLDAEKGKAPDDWADGVETKQPVASGLAREAIARHNARLDGSTLNQVQAWPEDYRPFGVLGALLGGQDGR